MEGLEATFAEMERAADDFTAAVQGVSEAVLSRRPDEQNWSAKEIICHVRDTEEYFLSSLPDDSIFRRTEIFTRRRGSLGLPNANIFGMMSGKPSRPSARGAGRPLRL